MNCHKLSSKILLKFKKINYYKSWQKLDESQNYHASKLSKTGQCFFGIILFQSKKINAKILNKQINFKPPLDFLQLCDFNLKIKLN